MAAVLLWLSLALIVWTHLGYGVFLWLWDKLSRTASEVAGTEALVKSHPDALADNQLPSVAFIIPCFAEQAVIEQKVHNTKALNYPPDKVRVIVACDGSPDDTAALALAAGADTVLDLPRGGKTRTVDRAVLQCTEELIVCSDANAMWQPAALRALVIPFVSEPSVAYACGSVSFIGERGDSNQEGIYWRYDMWLRAKESRLRSVTAGNGAIWAVRRERYMVIDPGMDHDLTFPFRLVKQGMRAVYVPAAKASERMVPSIEGEFRRKTRMMAYIWLMVFRSGIASPRGYPPGYAVMILSHRLLRYASPLLHLIALLANAALLALGAGTYAWLLLLAQLAVLVAAALAGLLPLRPFLLARYYVSMTASIAAGFWSYLRHGITVGWSAPEGTR